MGSQNGGPSLDHLVRQAVAAEPVVGIPVGEGGAIQPTDWRAALIWELDGIRVMLAEIYRQRGSDAVTERPADRLPGSERAGHD